MKLQNIFIPDLDRALFVYGERCRLMNTNPEIISRNNAVIRDFVRDALQAETAEEKTQ